MEAVVSWDLKEKQSVQTYFPADAASEASDVHPLHLQEIPLYLQM